MVNTDDNGGMSRLSTEKVKVSPIYYSKRIVRTVVIGLLSLAAVLALLYTFVLVPTSMRYVNTKQFGMVLTKDPSIKRGGIPAGKMELVTVGEDGDWMKSFGTKMNAGFGYHDDVAGMVVLTGPNGRLLSNKKGEMVIDGQTIKGSKMPVNYDTLKSKKWYLTNQYVALCITGECKAGETYIVPNGSILGEVKNWNGAGEHSDVVNEAVQVQERLFSKTEPLNDAKGTDAENRSHQIESKTKASEVE